MALVSLTARRLDATLLVVLVISAAAIALGVLAFGLTVAGGIALYFVVWWIVLFVILPFGIQSQAEAGAIAAGSEPGAPAAPALREKAIWTTIVAAIVFVGTVGLLPLAGL
jgi:predicted secreted protein